MVANSRSPNPRHAPYWERALPALRVELQQYLSRRLASLASVHEDLVHETLMALAERVRADRETLPASWYAHSSVAPDVDRQHFVRLATTILRRRVADHFRGRAGHWARARIESFEDTNVATPPSPADRAMLVRRMLTVCVAVLAEVPARDRELLAGVAGLEGEMPSALSARDRQRLRRLRVKLANAIREQLGEAAADLLREDP